MQKPRYSQQVQPRYSQQVDRVYQLAWLREFRAILALLGRAKRAHPPPRASLGGVPQESSCRLAAENMPAHWGEDNFGAKATAEIQSASAFERSLPSCMRASILRMVTDSKHQPLEADVVDTDTRSAACRQTVFETLPTCCPLESSLRSRM